MTQILCVICKRPIPEEQVEDMTEFEKNNPHCESCAGEAWKGDRNG